MNNAGICFHRPALEVPDEEFDEVFDVNVTGPVAHVAGPSRRT